MKLEAVHGRESSGFEGDGMTTRGQRPGTGKRTVFRVKSSLP